ncbi:MAG: tryptophan synthase subunit alpha [Candidatus Omnitrophica bacterium]|nr:tryptophan synthase subunit alpha [Candidatus Omnitrophota bacterium]
MKISQKFKDLHKLGKKAFLAYVPFGFPTLDDSAKIILALQDCGVDIVELGVPFSDPLADGPIIQAAANKALAQGANTDKLFTMLNSLKGKLKIPLVIMTYYNPVLKYGMDKFFLKMKKAQVSGVMIVDLPVEESKAYIKKANRFNLETIFFVTPTTSFTRAKKIADHSKGFIYYISVTGITGPQKLDGDWLAASVKRIRKVTQLPICVGFGIHKKSQVKEISEFSDGVIIGSEIVKFIDENSCRKDLVKRLSKHIRSLCIK